MDFFFFFFANGFFKQKVLLFLSPRQKYYPSLLSMPVLSSVATHQLWAFLLLHPLCPTRLPPAPLSCPMLRWEQVPSASQKLGT